MNGSARGYFTHASVVGIVLSLLTGLKVMAPNIPDWLIFVSGVGLALGGFIGLFLTGKRGELCPEERNQDPL